MHGHSDFDDSAVKECRSDKMLVSNQCVNVHARLWTFAGSWFDMLMSCGAFYVRWRLVGRQEAHSCTLEILKKQWQSGQQSCARDLCPTPGK